MRHQTCGLLFLFVFVAGAAAGAEKHLPRLITDLQSRKTIDPWPLRDVFMAELIRLRGPLPEGIALFPLAEMYADDRAVLVACVTERGAMREILRFGFVKAGGKWVPGDDAAERISENSATRVVRRRAGLTLDQLPLFIGYLMRDQASRFQNAQEKQDFQTCAAIIDEMLPGFSLSAAEELIRALRETTQNVTGVALASRAEQTDGRLLAEFAITEDDTKSSLRVYLAKRDGVWVIDGSYVAPARIAMKDLRTLAVCVEAWATDNDGLYPPAKTPEELRSLLEPVYVRKMPMTDPWGTPYRYEVSADRKGYRFISAGSDGKFDPKSWSRPNEALPDLAEDAVFENAAFVRAWKVEEGN